jgi:Domain of unknown function (DUF1996)
MRRPLLALLLVVAVGAVAGAGAAVGATDSNTRAKGQLHRGTAYFAVLCAFSHRNQDDPIVYPNQPGKSHDHTYFGNTSTKASSTPASLRAAGQTTCRPHADTAAYWAPTLFVRGDPVAPRYAVAYYVRRSVDLVRPFPPGLKMIAGNAAARAPQDARVTFWSCGAESFSSSIPDCVTGRQGALRLKVTFPDCWDGRRLDSADHKSHMAYSSGGRCPASHPVAVPGLVIVIQYPVSGGAGAELASGGDFSGHADFVNAWDQRTLAALVDRYLNRTGFR